MIIGVTGTNGAGKGTVVDYLVTKHGFAHYSAREFLAAEMHKRGMPDNRSSLREVGNDLRKQFGPAYVIESLWNEAKQKGGNAVIESIRGVDEARFLKNHGAVLLGVDGDRQLRYDRIVQRGHGTDKVSFEDFCIQEDREMSSIEAWDMNIFSVMKLADTILINNGTLDELRIQIDALSIFA